MDQIIFNLWEKHSGALLDMGRKILAAAVIIAAGRIVVFIGRRVIHNISSGRLNFDKTIASILRMVLNYGTLLVCLIMILDTFGFNTASLIAILGAAGVAVGLALKDTLSNIASGIIILILRPFGLGDFIEFGSSMGTVKEIGLFTTEIETFDGIFISAPNSSIWGTPLKNYSRNLRRRMEITIRIAYNDSIDAAFRVLEQIISEEKRFLSDPAPQIVVQSLGEYGVHIALRAWASSDVYWSIYWEQLRKVKERIEEAGLTIPLPRRDIKFLDGQNKENRNEKP